MATVAQHLTTVLASMNRLPADVNAVFRFVPEIGQWLPIGRDDFINAAQAVDHPLPAGARSWYRFESQLPEDADLWLLYNGNTTLILDPGANQSFTAAQLDGSATFPI